MVTKIYHSEPQLNKAITSDSKAAFLDLHLSISNNIVSTKIYDKGDDLSLKLSISYNSHSAPLRNVRLTVI